jgi:hypothetical protein
VKTGSYVWRAVIFSWTFLITILLAKDLHKSGTFAICIITRSKKFLPQALWWRFEVGKKKYFLLRSSSCCCFSKKKWQHLRVLFFPTHSKAEGSQRICVNCGQQNHVAEPSIAQRLFYVRNWHITCYVLLIIVILIIIICHELGFDRHVLACTVLVSWQEENGKK